MSDSMTAQVIELQTQLSFQEDLLTALNQRVAAQDRQLQQLNQAVLRLQDSARQMQQLLSEQGGDEQEKPPHY